MKTEKKINYDINYVVVKCESKAHEKFRFAIRNGVCEPEVEIVGGYYYLFWRNWENNAQQTKLIMIIVNKLLQNKNSGYRFVFFRKGENDYDYEWFSNCENAFEFMRESTTLRQKGEKK